MPSNITCHKCGNAQIVYYKQRRKDGVMVVTARCINGHIPEKGKPFYPISQFNISALPLLGSETSPQMELIPNPNRAEVLGARPETLLDYVEQKRNNHNNLFPTIGKRS